MVSNKDTASTFALLLDTLFCQRLFKMPIFVPNPPIVYVLLLNQNAFLPQPQESLRTLPQPRMRIMSQHEPDQIFAFHQRAAPSSGRPIHGPVATYDQIYAFLLKLRSKLSTRSLSNMNYILANLEPLQEIQIYLTLLSSRTALQAQTSENAHKRKVQTAAKFQQAWDLVDAKTNAIAAQSKYIDTVAQELACVYRTHSTPPNKRWDMICASLIYELQEALRTRQGLRWEREDAEDRAEQWEARYVLADRRWKERHQDAIHLRQAYERMHNEYMAGEAMREIFMRNMSPVREWVNERFEAKRVQRINLALEREGQWKTVRTAPLLGSEFIGEELEIWEHQIGPSCSPSV